MLVLILSYLHHNILLQICGLQFPLASHFVHNVNSDSSDKNVCVCVCNQYVLSMSGQEAAASKTNGRATMLPPFPQFSCLSENDVPVTEHNLASPPRAPLQHHLPPHMRISLTYAPREHAPLQPRGIHFLIFLDWENNTHALTMLTSLMLQNAVVMELWLVVSAYRITHIGSLSDLPCMRGKIKLREKSFVYELTITILK